MNLEVRKKYRKLLTKEFIRCWVATSIAVRIAGSKFWHSKDLLILKTVLASCTRQSQFYAITQLDFLAFFISPLSIAWSLAIKFASEKKTLEKVFVLQRTTTEAKNDPSRKSFVCGWTKTSKRKTKYQKKRRWCFCFLKWQWFALSMMLPSLNHFI